MSIKTLFTKEEADFVKRIADIRSDANGNTEYRIGNVFHDSGDGRVYCEDKECETEVSRAVNTLINALKDDAGYYLGWQSNIAMAFLDTWEAWAEIHGISKTTDYKKEIANHAARHFLSILMYPLKPTQESKESKT